MFLVLSAVCEGEAGGVEHLANPSFREFVTVFSVDRLARLKVEGQSWAGAVCGDVDLLFSNGDKVHLDTGLRIIPSGFMTEGVGIKVRAEIAVDPSEDVAVEGSGDTVSVVVSGDQLVDGLGGS